MSFFKNIGPSPSAVPGGFAGIASNAPKPNDPKRWNDPNAKYTTSIMRRRGGRLLPDMQGVKTPEGHPIKRFTPTLVYIREAFAGWACGIQGQQIARWTALMDAFEQDSETFNSSQFVHDDYEEPGDDGVAEMKKGVKFLKTMFSLFQALELPQRRDIWKGSCDEIFYVATQHIYDMSEEKVKSLYLELAYGEPVWVKHQGWEVQGHMRMVLRIWEEVLDNRIDELRGKRDLDRAKFIVDVVDVD